MKSKYNKIACAILAGGKNSRMGGKNKAFFNIEGSPILEIMIKVLGKIFGEIIIITNSPEEYESFKKKYTIVTDKIKNVGPLGGIYSAILQTSKEAIFIVPCDMPFLNKKFIEKQISNFKKTNCDAIIPKIGNFIEPLHAIYKKDIYKKLHTFLQNTQNYSIKAFLNNIEVYYLDVEDNIFNNKMFTNINSPEDIKKIKK